MPLQLGLELFRAPSCQMGQIVCVGSVPRMDSFRSSLHMVLGTLPLLGTHLSYGTLYGIGRDPPSYKVHMWKARHDRLLTNNRSSKWNLGSSSDCRRCIGISKTCLNKLQIFVGANVQDWISLNLRTSMGEFDDGWWATIFMVACHKIWYWRNKELFEEGFARPINPCRCVVEKASTIRANRDPNGAYRLGRCSRQMLGISSILMEQQKETLGTQLEQFQMMFLGLHYPALLLFSTFVFGLQPG